MKKCKECGNEVSTKAEKCPHCGAKAKKGGGCIGLIVLVVLLSILGSFLSESDNSKTKTSATSTSKTSSPPETQEQIRADKIKKSFSGWDGSHVGLRMLIKETMNDPGSYDHVKTIYWDNGDHLIVKTTFRGKNVFGAIVKNWISAKVDLDGNVIVLIDQGP